MVRSIRTTFIDLALAATLVLGGAISAHATSIGLTGFVNFFDDPNPWNITGVSEVTSL